MADESDSVHDKVSKITRAGIKADDMLDMYKTWAEVYDKDMESDGYTGYRKVVRVLAESQGERRDIRVLDVAAGTGLCGQELSKLGFSNIDALDASQDMLDVAKTKNVYKNFIKEFLGTNQLDIDADSYDAVIGSGLFANGHVKPDCLEQLIRIVKPGGMICLAVREERLRTNEDCKDLKPRMTALQSEGLWERVFHETFPGYSTGLDGVVYLYKVL
ncbi:PREDICTED: Williams-Beuren syndrome chromosomal region 27 protein-like [Branchiostoma belcheri]|uniref:Williams-Beuren syndrome chromosomal region 27 protein-like n=1 Tax=Branchiostoma belcheri TaxID=7741 RepID=A0A6P4ZMT4_BRABE|nr:PREDICTED: Williams-Beuren syndrome chromosomal region 27 protein-like [Branchiostoma belcheri]